MVLLSLELKKDLKQLLTRLNASKRSVILLNAQNFPHKDQLKEILDMLKAFLSEGTLCVIGDCSFNVSSANLESLSQIDSKKRSLIYTSLAMKVMTLYEDVSYLNHPSLEMAAVGRHAQFLMRHQSLDFPYGPASVFQDLYDLDAIYISLGKDDHAYALRYALAKQDPVIVRNVCLYEDKQYAYLDYDVSQFQAPLYFEGKSLYEDRSSFMYGESYRYLIHEVEKELS